MNIWELEKSGDVLDRQKYAERIKGEFIPRIELRIKALNEQWQMLKLKLFSTDNEQYRAIIKSKIDTCEYEAGLEKRFLKNLKIRLSNYDIYKQTMPCLVCGEIVCICYEADRSFEEEIKTLF